MATIVVNQSSIVYGIVMLMGADWVYLLSHPGEDEEE